MSYVPWDCALPDFCNTADLELCKAVVGQNEHLSFLATRQGKSRSHKAAGHVISKAAHSIGIEKSAHGLRKARAATLAEHGATASQIGAWTGHRSLAEIAHYTAEMDRRRAVTGTSSTDQKDTRSEKGIPRDASICKI